jgi:hypothetical protein
MNLLVRTNLALALAFALAALAVGRVCSSMLQANAKREALREAGLMMDSALSMRAYRSEEIVPLLNAQMPKEFLPQSVPSYMATQNFLKLRDQHPEYAYREANLNRTNLCERAVDWETDIERAVHKQLPVLPFRLEDIVPSKNLEYFLSSQHWLDGFPPPREPHHERLRAHVAARLNAAESPLAVPHAPGPAAAATNSAPAFSAQQLQSLERQLAHHIGPLAQHLVRRTAAQAPDWERLIGRLAAEIDSDAARQQFINTCRTLSRPKP